MKTYITLSHFVILTTFKVFSQTEPEREGKACGGVERWAIKVLTDPSAMAVDTNPILSTITNLTLLSTPTPSTTMARYIGVEDKTYKVVCKITIKKAESDNDYHLVLSDTVNGNTLIGEIPDPVCPDAANSIYVNQYIAARNFVNTYIASGNVSNINLPAVEVTGVAFIDPPHGQTGKAPNNLELHPILYIHFYTPPPVIDHTGINELIQTILDVKLSPNPIINTCTIHVTSKINDLKKCEFKIYNMIGAVLKEFDLPVQNNSMINYEFNRDGFKSGMYIYRITNNDIPLYEGKLEIL